MRALVISCLLVALSACGPPQRDPAEPDRSIAGTNEELELARIECMIELDADAYPSNETYQRAVDACARDRLNGT